MPPETTEAKFVGSIVDIIDNDGTIWTDATIESWSVNTPIPKPDNPEREIITGNVVALSSNKSNVIVVVFKCELAANCNIDPEDLIQIKCLYNG